MANLTESQVYSYAKDWANVYGPKYGADPNDMARVLTGIAKVESTFNPNAKNKKSTARGLMQLLINTQREIESKHAKVPFAIAGVRASSFSKAPVGLPDKIYDPNYAMQLAAAYLGYQFKRYGGDWQKAIHAYNQGSFPGTRKQDGINYLAKVTNAKSNQTEQLAYISRNKTVTDKRGNQYVYSVFI